MTDAELVRKYVDLYNSGDAAALGAFYAPDVTLVEPMSPEATKGRETVVATGSAFRRAFPDMVWTLTGDPVVGCRGDRVGAARHRHHDRSLPGPDGEIPPTGKAFAVDMGIFWTFGADGLITEERAYFDGTGMMAQLGLVG